MKETYYALYNSKDSTWSVVKTVEYETYLAVFLPDAGSQNTAEEIARKLND